jgi:hypothetical protein
MMTKAFVELVAVLSGEGLEAKEGQQNIAARTEARTRGGGIINERHIEKGGFLTVLTGECYHGRKW